MKYTIRSDGMCGLGYLEKYVSNVRKYNSARLKVYFLLRLSIDCIYYVHLFSSRGTTRLFSSDRLDNSQASPFPVPLSDPIKPYRPAG